MDYEFRRDLAGNVIAHFSMGHEAVGHWLNEEVKGDLGAVDDVERAIAEVKGSERQWQKIGHEYTLCLDKEAVMIRANQLALETDELEEGMAYYDEESLSFCGIDDFAHVLKRYRQFVSER